MSFFFEYESALLEYEYGRECILGTLSVPSIHFLNDVVEFNAQVLASAKRCKELPLRTGKYRVYGSQKPRILSGPNATMTSSFGMLSTKSQVHSRQEELYPTPEDQQPVDSASPATQK
jgi:hypothetical protein